MKVTKEQYKERARKAVVTRILNNTKAFNKLPKNKKAILIAKDVLSQIKLGFYSPAHVGYIDLRLFNQYNKNYDAQLSLLNNPLKDCKVCALGACLLSVARLGDRLQMLNLYAIQNNTNDYDIQIAINKLLMAFDKKTLNIIESIYEDYHYTQGPLSKVINPKGLSEPTLKKVSIFVRNNSDDIRHSVEDNVGIMIAIMKNIIKNDGKFVFPETKIKKEKKTYVKTSGHICP